MMRKATSFKTHLDINASQEISMEVSFFIERRVYGLTKKLVYRYV